MSVMMPAGTYYVGDLCYVMHDDWDDACELFFLGRDDMLCNEGKLTFKDGRQFVSFDTMYGDGIYYDTKRLYSFCVDAGLIGCIRVEDIREELPEDAVIVTFDHDFKCSSKDGVLTFGHIEIDTAGHFEEECCDQHD